MKKFFNRIIENWLSNDNTLRAAAIAFYALFSLPPLLFLIADFATLMFSKETVQRIMFESMGSFMNQEILKVIKDIFVSSADYHLTNSIISFLIVFYASSKIFTELRTAINHIYKVERFEDRSKIFMFIESKIIALTLVSVTCLLSFLTLAVNFLLNKIEITPQGFLYIFFLHILNNFSSVFILGGIFFCLYKFVPSRKINSTAALIGSLVGVFLFEIGKYLIALYLSVSVIAGFYGSMGSLIMLMFWIYYIAQIVLLGAEFAINIERKNESLLTL